MKQLTQRRISRWTWMALVGVIIPVLWGSPETVRADPFIIDQANDAFTPGLFQNIERFQPIGQEFTPNLKSLHGVELVTEDFGRKNGIGANLMVNIRKDTIYGTLVGSSLDVTLPDNFGGITHFDFSSDVSLIPGSLYVIELLVTSGDGWGVGSSGGPFSTYPVGNQILWGASHPNNDLWFREGPIPEPATVLLLGPGLIGLLGYGRKKFSKK